MIDILAKVGLTTQESRVYLGLLELKEAQTGELCGVTGIASSNIYRVLDVLLAKGLASYRIHNNIRVYMPAPPDALNDLFCAKQEELEKERKQVESLIANLKRRKIEDPPYSHYKYYEGIGGVKSLWHELQEQLSSTPLIRIHGGTKESYSRLVGFYDEYHAQRASRGVPAKIIIPAEEAKLAQRRAGELAQVRFMELDNIAEWGIAGEYFYIQYIVTKRPRAFLIRDKIFAETFANAFDRIWEGAQPKGL